MSKDEIIKLGQAIENVDANDLVSMEMLAGLLEEKDLVCE